MKEMWRKFVSGYEVSNLGRVRSLDRSVKTSNGFRKYSGRILSTKATINGYPVVNINRKATKIHQIVAKTFLGYSTGNGFVVNHINGVKHDNRLSNLEVITQSENLKHAIRLGLKPKQKNFGSKNSQSKKVVDIKTGRIYDSLAELIRETPSNVFSYTALRAQLNGQNRNVSPYKYL